MGEEINNVLRELRDYLDWFVNISYYRQIHLIDVSKHLMEIKKFQERLGVEKTEDEMKKSIEKVIESGLKRKFKCLACGAILDGQDGVREHKKLNTDHYEYDMLGSKLRMGFL